MARCVILGRDNRVSPWELIAISEKKNALVSAALTKAQEELLGHSKFEIIVVLETDYDKRKIRPITS